jgi:hypothetical protein
MNEFFSDHLGMVILINALIMGFAVLYFIGAGGPIFILVFPLALLSWVGTILSCLCLFIVYWHASGRDVGWLFGITPTNIGGAPPGGAWPGQDNSKYEKRFRDLESRIKANEQTAYHIGAEVEAYAADREEHFEKDDF